MNTTQEKASENQTLNSYWIETYFLYCLSFRVRSEIRNINRDKGMKEEKRAQSEWVLMSWVWTIPFIEFTFSFDLTMMIVSREMKRISDSYNQWASKLRNGERQREMKTQNGISFHFICLTISSSFHGYRFNHVWINHRRGKTRNGNCGEKRWTMTIEMEKTTSNCWMNWTFLIRLDLVFYLIDFRGCFARVSSPLDV